MLGRAPDALILTHEAWFELMHEDDAPRAADALAEHLAGNIDEFRAEYRLRAADGSYCWVLASACGQAAGAAADEQPANP